MEANLNFLQLDLKHTNLSSFKREKRNNQSIAMAITWWCVVCKFQTGYSKEATQVKDFVFLNFTNIIKSSMRFIAKMQSNGCAATLLKLIAPNQVLLPKVNNK